jgi:hypothetical protein
VDGNRQLGACGVFLLPTTSVPPKVSPRFDSSCFFIFTSKEAGIYKPVRAQCSPLPAFPSVPRVRTNSVTSKTYF